MRWRGVSAIGLAMLSACGSGGGSGGGTITPPQNQAPVFTSSSAVNVAENAAGIVYQAGASDADGNALTFSISGGADAALFRITQAGGLSFAAAPAYEEPLDADRNNVYQVTIGVSDGTTTVTLPVAVTVTIAPQGAQRLVASGFDRPVQGVFEPDRREILYVVEKGGRIWSLNLASGARTLMLDVSSEISTDGSRGLLGMALGSATVTYPPSGGVTFCRPVLLYLTNRAGDIEIRNYCQRLATFDQSSGSTVLTIPHRAHSNNNGGWIAFGPDKNLYLGVGDGGGTGDPDNNAQNTRSLLGKILRIDITRDDFPNDPNRNYAIPSDNPFVSGGGAPEVLASGLRDPASATFDLRASPYNLYIADRGQDAVEEINLLRPTLDFGRNYGWPFFEGTRPHRSGAAGGLTAPVAEYQHGIGPREGGAITMGVAIGVGAGALPFVNDRLSFGDATTGNLWLLAFDKLVQGTTLSSARFELFRSELRPQGGTLNQPVSFATNYFGTIAAIDFDGEVYLLN